jgi:hypothetical protein
VPILPYRLVDHREITAAVERATRALTPDVVRIGYSIATDWTGDQSIFFRIILSDEAASKEKQLGEIAQSVESAILSEVNVDELGLQYYFNYRSQSEQASLNDRAWA